MHASFTGLTPLRTNQDGKQVFNLRDLMAHASGLLSQTPPADLYDEVYHLRVTQSLIIKEDSGRCELPLNPDLPFLDQISPRNG